MPRAFPEDCIQKITFLERNVGARVSYKLLEPFTIDASDLVDIQRAAAEIAKFIGLVHYTYIVAFAKQKEKVGGHIELRRESKEVFIEIDSELMNFPRAVLATLAHEITHKFLQVNNISCGPGFVQEYENEILTDICSVFLGLGKLMLNGCEGESRSVTKVGNESRTEIRTLRVGYLERQQLAYAYCLIAAMRRTVSTEFRRGLTAEALGATKQCMKMYAEHFDESYHDKDSPIHLLKELQVSIDESQMYVTDIEKDTAYLQHSVIGVAKEFVNRTRQKHATTIAMRQNEAMTEAYDPCKRYLDLLALKLRITADIADLASDTVEACRLAKGVRRITRYCKVHGKLFLRLSQTTSNVTTGKGNNLARRLSSSLTSYVKKTAIHIMRGVNATLRK